MKEVTLYDGIRDKKLFEEVLHAAILQGLVDLGPRVRELDWANFSLSSAPPRRKAA